MGRGPVWWEGAALLDGVGQWGAPPGCPQALAMTALSSRQQGFCLRCRAGLTTLFPSVTGESWHSPLLGRVRIPRRHTGQRSEPGRPLCRSSHILPLGEVLGDGEGQGRPAAARMPSRELATALCSARNHPSEAWASWGTFVGKEEEDSAATGSRLWLLWGLARAMEPGPRGSPRADLTH